MPNEQITIRTRDGECTLRIATPAADGSWPAVIFYMDAGGIRPAVIEMAQRLADAGYVVLLPDLFYRYGAYGPFVPKEVFAGDFRAILGPLMATIGNDKAAEDTEAFLASLDARGDVAGRKVGAVGFCMGGGMALAAAGTYPDRFGAVVELPRRQSCDRRANQPPPVGSGAGGRGLYCRCRGRRQLSASDGRAI